jgi:hypothetical protein
MKKSKKNEKFTNEITTGDDLFIKGIDTDNSTPIVSDELKNDLPADETQTEVSKGSRTESAEIPQSINGGEIETAQPEIKVSPDPEPTADEPKPKRKGRGRPKKAQTTEKTETETKADLLDLIPDRPEPEPIRQETAPRRFEVGKYISGSLVLLLIDSVVPGLLLLGAKKAGVSGLENVKTSDICLDSHEKKELEPLAHEAVKEIMADVSPGAAFLIAVSVIYGGKLMLNRETE